VISVLSILVVAGLGVVRENANQTKCAANLRQIYVACNLYSNEHGMKLIPANTLNALNDGDYLSKNSEVWICPTPRRSCTATTSRRVPGAGRAT
jgi:hypothetical protein